MKEKRIQQQNRRKFYRFNKFRGPRINHYIKADKIKLIDQEGKMLGVVTVNDGIKRAKDIGLDLVEISPNTNPPICKILDFGKYRYQLKKKKSKEKKKQKTINKKEIRFRPGIDQHDYEIKMKQIHKFLGNKNKVKITLRFKGRELGHRELGEKLLDKIQEEIKQIASIEQKPKMLGRQIIMILNPIN